MAEFNNQDGNSKWYNIISRQIMNEVEHSEPITLGVTKEESSDESTIISSQTSTLTRNQGKNIEHLKWFYRYLTVLNFEKRRP